MNPLFSEAGLSELRKICAKKTLFAFDFDGTLAPIAKVPGGAHTPPLTCELMEELRTLAPTAVITGRRIKDLKPRLGFRADHLIGNHGAEGRTVKRLEIAEARKLCRRWKTQIERAVKTSGLPTWRYMEDKGQTLTLHYRRVPNRRQCRRALLEAIRDLDPSPRIVGGKYVYNLVPQGLPHKGGALKILCRDLNVKSAFFIGDDDTDEDAFRKAPANWLTVRVGNPKSSEARYYLRQQNSINRLLKVIIRELKASR